VLVGAPTAMGVLEAEYNNDLDCEAGEELAVKAVKAAVARDAVSGDGIDLLIIRPGGVEERSISLRGWRYIFYECFDLPLFFAVS